MFRAVVLIFAFVGIATANVVRPLNVLADDPRIVNGTVAVAGEFPIIVSLQWTTGEHFCGATILNENWVLTAAHCVFGEKPSGLQIRAGINTYQSGGVTRGIIKINMHSAFNNSGNYPNDIAVLQLDSPLTFSSTIQPTVLAAAGADYSGPGTICGWGDDKTGGTTQPNLMKANVPVITDAQCLSVYGTGPTPQNICAGGNGIGGCVGDSGGPLLTTAGEQVGVTSWGRGPCGGTPGVWTQVSYYRDWINNNMNRAGKNSSSTIVNFATILVFLNYLREF